MFSQLSPLLPAWQSPCCEVLKSRLRGGICLWNLACGYHRGDAPWRAETRHTRCWRPGTTPVILYCKGRWCVQQWGPHGVTCESLDPMPQGGNGTTAEMGGGCTPETARPSLWTRMLTSPQGHPSPPARLSLSPCCPHSSPKAQEPHSRPVASLFWPC